MGTFTLNDSAPFTLVLTFDLPPDEWTDAYWGPFVYTLPVAGAAPAAWPGTQQTLMGFGV